MSLKEKTDLFLGVDGAWPNALALLKSSAGTTRYAPEHMVRLLAQVG